MIIDLEKRQDIKENRHLYNIVYVKRRESGSSMLLEKESCEQKKTHFHALLEWIIEPQDVLADFPKKLLSVIYFAPAD